MERQEQGVLLEIPEQPEREAAQTASSPKLKPIERQQGLLLNGHCGRTGAGKS